MSDVSRRNFLGGIVASIAGTELIVRTQSAPTGLKIDQEVHIIQPGDPEWIYSGYHWDFGLKMGDEVFNRKGEKVGLVLESNFRRYTNTDLAGKKYALFKDRIPGGPDNDVFEGGTMPIATVGLFNMGRSR